MMEHMIWPIGKVVEVDLTDLYLHFFKKIFEAHKAGDDTMAVDILEEFEVIYDMLIDDGCEVGEE